MDTLTRPTPRSATSPARGLPRRRRILVAAAVAATAIAGGVVLSSMPGHEMARPAALLAPDVRGVYVLEDGRELTLIGTEAEVRTELDDLVTYLDATGPDNFTSHDGDRLALLRDTAGRVTGLEITRDDIRSTATRTEPYTEHEITFGSEGAVIAGTLLVPTAAGPHPGVVISHGAERASRETYRLLATHYARRGVATLIYDKRGTGGSDGDVASATFEELTADALAGHRLLTAHPDVDPARVGIAGYSQGGWIGALAARHNDAVAFVIAYSASGFSPGDQHAWLHGNMLSVRGYGPRPITAAERFQETLYSTTDLVDAGHVAPFPHVPGFWFHALDHRLETADLWQQVRQPVLGMWGGEDCQVPAHQSAEILRDALDRGDNTTYTLRVLDGADHSMLLVGPCLHELGRHADVMRYAPGYLGGAAEWIGRLDSHPPDREYDAPAPSSQAALGWHHQPPTSPPWYGHVVTQTAAVLALLGAFGLLTTRAIVRASRRRPRSTTERLVTATGAAGLASVIVVFSALGELAALGAVHARQLVGTGPVAASPPLFLVAAVLVTATVWLTVATFLDASRPRSGRRAQSDARAWPRWLAAASATGLALWAVHWQVPWLPGGLF